MFIYQIPGSNWGIISTPPWGYDPFTFSISHFPHWLDPWGKTGIFFLRCAPCAMFWKHSDKENMAGPALSTAVISNNPGTAGLQWKERREFFFPWPSLCLRKIQCHMLLRPVTAGLSPLVAFVWWAVDISFSPSVTLQMFVSGRFTSAGVKQCQFEMLCKWLH